MVNKKSKEINEQVEWGLGSLDPERTIEIKLVDFMHIYKAFEEFNRFFHQPDHYPSIEDVQIYLGNKDAGAYAVISKIYYEILSRYLPKDIEASFDEKNCPLEHPDYPYYYRVKNDENIDDGTLYVKDRQSFVKFAQNLLEEYQEKGENWENNSLSHFIEAIGAYAKDIDGYYKHMKFDTSADTPRWRIFAQILNGARVYE